MGERTRQFKMLISDEEWEKLLEIAEKEGSTATAVLRDFIRDRYAALRKSKQLELDEIADDLVRLARNVRAHSAR